MGKPGKELFEFGQFRLNPAERLLLRGDEPVPLEPKVFETLLVLVRQHGRLVEKNELMQAVWPDTFVEEINLARNISTLRKALGQAGDDSTQLFIETVPQHGYRFVTGVRVIPTEVTEVSVRESKRSVVVEEEEESEGVGESERVRVGVGESESGRVGEREQI